MKRKYLDRIEVWLRQPQDDGFGGNLSDDVKLTDSWCNIRTLRRDKLVSYGLDVSQQAIEIKLRYRDDLDYFREGIFFRYRCKNWGVSAIEEKDLDGREIVILAVAEQ